MARGSRRFTGTSDVEHQPEVFHHGSTFDYFAARQKEVILEPQGVANVDNLSDIGECGSKPEHP